jgi:hypothetical protein
MYSSLRNGIFSALDITGSYVAQYIYLGLIVFVISSFIVREKWSQFVGTLITGLVIIALDILFAGETLGTSVYHLLHFILMPLLVTSVIRR